MLREDAIQKAVFQHLRTRGLPGIVAFHPKNGGVHQRGRRRGINAGQGVVSGACDVIVIAPPNGRVYALELKADRGTLSEAQEKFMADVQRAGGEAGVAYGLDEALQWLEARALLKGQRFA
jgi:hypothetical protein